MLNRLKWVSMVGLALLLVACGGGGGCALSLGGLTSCDSSTVAAAPVARVGADQTVLTGSQVALDATGSTAGGATLNYKWVWSYKPVGSMAALSSDTASKPTFTADRTGTYVLVLTASSGAQNSAPVVATIQAVEENVAPVARAGANQSVMVGDTVTLDGSASTDANPGDLLTYSWRLSAPAGSKAQLDSATAVKPHFRPDVGGTYVATLMVSDGRLNSALPGVDVRVDAADLNAVPVANAGGDQNVVRGALVTLDGSRSSDANPLDQLTFNWSFVSKPIGSTATLDSATAVRPKFTADMVGSYDLSLSVNDGKVSSPSAKVSVFAALANAAPVANAGANQSVVVGSLASLSGAASSDANPGDVLTYKWTMVSKPAGSVAALSSTTVVAPTFTADLVGTYVAILVVNDGKTDSTVSSTTVTSVAVNVAPVARGVFSPALITSLASVGGSAATATVTLDASTSTDANYGDLLTYRWVLTSRPALSTATLTANPTNAAQATFVADKPGNYIATLQVSDGKLDNLTTVLIIAN